MDCFHVCVHVPELAAQALLRLRPELEAAAVVVLSGDAPLEQVCSVNEQAKRLGVVAGMTRAQLESFPGACVLKRSAAEERTACAALLETAGSFTPRLEVQLSAGAAFCFVMDMTGSTRLFGTPRQMVQKIVQAMAALRMSVQLAGCANLRASMCLASVACAEPILVPYGMEAEYLRNLPLATLSLTEKQAETLGLWGLHTLGELARLPEVELVARMGQQGKRLRLLARGEHPHLMVPEEPVFTLEEYLAFDAPVELLESLLFVLGPMLDQVLARAQNRAYALASVQVVLGLDGGAEHERTIRPALPTASREVLLKLLHLDLQAHAPSAGIVSIFIHAEPGDISKVQLGLFCPQLPESSRLDVTLARIAALVGEERVGSAKLTDSHCPDSFIMERFTVPRSSDTPSVAASAARHSIALRRCRPPVLLFVEQHGPRPARLFWKGRRYHVQNAFGPWRKSGDWWSSEVWSHEEWDIHARTDAEETLLCVVTLDLLRKEWHLAGLYD